MMDLSWDTTVRFFHGNGEPGYRCTFRGCLAIFAGIAPDERFAAYAEFEQPVVVGRDRYIEMSALELEKAATLLNAPLH